MIDEYLRLLGRPAQPAPSVEELIMLHRAQVERVAYTNLTILLGEPGSTDRRASARRVVSGGGGYCFQLNGAFSLLLEQLGYRVTLHRGFVAGDDEWSTAPHEVALNHLVLVVHDLPTANCPDGDWLVDAGLGDAIHAPLPLVAGVSKQGPFRFQLGAAAGRTGWRLGHHHAGSFAAMEFEAQPAELADFDEVHRDLSTSATSPFTGTFTAQRRDEDGVDVLRGCHLIRIDGAGRVERDVADFDDWSAVVRDRFGLSGELAEALWPRVAAAHRDWLARRITGSSAPAQPAGPANALQDAATA